MMNRRVIAFWLSLTMVLGFIVILVEIAPVVKAPAIIYVDDVPGTGPNNPDENYTVIQDAVNAAQPGDTVFVYGGTYYEHVILNKTINLIGENRDNTTIDGSGSGDVVRITSDYVNVSGFTVKGSGANPFEAGVEVYMVGNCIFEDCNFSYNTWGIYLSDSNNILIRNNIFIRNEDGIRSYTSSYNRIEFNDCKLNKFHGVSLWSSSYNLVLNNSLNRNSGPTSIGGGVVLSTSNNNFVYNNDCSDPIHSQSFGIHIEASSPSNLISYNEFRNARYGIQIMSNCNNNTFHHNNIVNNIYQVFFSSPSSNNWDDGMGEGNYWSDYNGLDDGSGGRVAGDGVGDTEIPHPYINQGNGYYQLDNYPLMKPSSIPKNYTILKQGWNLVSIRMIQQQQNLKEVLASIDGKYDAVQWYDITDSKDLWKHYKVGKPYGNDLSEINETMGFWIHIIPPGDTIFFYNGTPLTFNQTITLYPGWNLVGYPSLSKNNRTEALNNISFPHEVDSIWTYDAATKKWKVLGPSEYFEPGRGYWIHANQKCIWEVPL